MSRINTNIESLIARRAIGNNVGCWKWDVGYEKIRCLCSLTSAIRHRTSNIDSANRVDTIVPVAGHGLQVAGSLNSLEVANENVMAAESAIRDADFAIETSRLTRAQILASSSISVLQPANARPRVGSSAQFQMGRALGCDPLLPSVSFGIGSIVGP